MKPLNSNVGVSATAVASGFPKPVNPILATNKPLKPVKREEESNVMELEGWSKSWLM